MSFPKILDGAHVLYFTQQGPYGMIQYTTGELADSICCLAIGSTMMVNHIIFLAAMRITKS